jgi:hypothetical protein
VSWSWDVLLQPANFFREFLILPLERLIFELQFLRGFTRFCLVLAIVVSLALQVLMAFISAWSSVCATSDIFTAVDRLCDGTPSHDNFRHFLLTLSACPFFSSSRHIKKRHTRDFPKKKMPDFVDVMLSKTSAARPAAQVVQEFKNFYKARYEEAVSSGRVRQLSYLSNVQSSLSKFKKKVQAPQEWKKELHLTREEMQQLAKERMANLRSHSIDMSSIDADQTIADCRALLRSPNIILRIIGVAALTGRRMAEIVSSASFRTPHENHKNPHYWSNMTGLLKQRGNLKDCDAPLLAPREEIVSAVDSIRKKLGSIPPAEVNRRVGKSIARAMKRYVPQIGNIHGFRKFYVLATFHYFNERNCSIARFAADVLCHKEMSTAVLPYLNMHLKDMGSLDFA